jgi:two-component system sensor histidine kinase EvgS
MKTFTLLLNLFFFLTSLGAYSLNLTKEEKEWIKNHKTVNVGADFRWPPFEFANIDKKHSGLASEYIKLISHKTGLDFNVTTDIWANVLKDVKTDKYDMLSCVIKTEDRSKYLNFTQPYLSIPSVIVVNNGFKKEIESIKDLLGLKVSLNKDSYTHEWIKYQYPDLDLLLSNSSKESIEMVSLGKADAYIGNISVVNYVKNKYLLNNLKILNIAEGYDTHISMAADKDKPILLGILQKALASITPKEHAKLRSRWENINNEHQNINFTKKELAWIKTHQLIKYTGDPDWLPFEGVSETNEHIGIAAEYVKFIKRYSGIEFKYTPADSWDDAIDKIMNKDVSMIIETTDSKLNLKYTKPFISNSIVIIMDEKTPYIESLDLIEDKKIAVIKNYGYVPRLKQNYPDINFYEVENINEGLSAVSTGKYDALLCTFALGSYSISEMGIHNIKIVGKTNISTSVGFGVVNEEKILVDIINKILGHIDSKTKHDILMKWTYQKYVEKIDYTLIWQVGGILLLILIVSFFWNAKLSKLNQQLKEQKKTFEDIYNEAADAIILLDNHKIIDCNKSALVMLGYHSKDELLTRSPQDISPKKQADGVTSSEKSTIFSQKALDEGSYHFEWLLKRFNAQIFWADVALTKIKIDKKDIIHARIIDIQKQKESEEKILSAKLEAEDAKEKALQASKAKSAFLSNMSHEIRTPMNSILGFAELLNEEVEDKRLKSFIKTILSSGQTLLFLINDILDLSKIESGKMEIVKSKVALKNLLEEIYDIFKLQAQKKSLQFELIIDKNIPKALLLDDVRLKEVFINLIGNAIKFTDHGYVKIITKVTEVYEHKSKIDISIDIKDSGIGIDATNINKIFEDFEQSQNQDIKKYGGTGLGLAISKKLIELMDGELKVESEPLKGSCFSVKLKNIDIATLGAEDKIYNEDTDYAQIKFNEAVILIVDDIKENRELIKASFFNSQISVIEAKNGQEAITMAKEHKPDLILMDIRMPVMDGYSATRAIKEFSDIPIIALTASIMQDELKKIQIERFNGYLRKPVSKAELFKEISRYIDYEKTVLESFHT